MRHVAVWLYMQLVGTHWYGWVCKVEVALLGCGMVQVAKLSCVSEPACSLDSQLGTDQALLKARTSYPGATLVLWASIAVSCTDSKNPSVALRLCAVCVAMHAVRPSAV